MFTKVNRNMEEPSAMSDCEFFGIWDTQSEFWKMEGKINYQYCFSLADVEFAVKQGNYETAKAALLAYYQARHGYRVLADFESARNTEVTKLLMDWILTLSGESYATTITVGNEYQAVQGDVTEHVKQAVASGNELSFLLMARHKGDLAKFHSRKQSVNQPQLEIMIDGQIHKRSAIKDTYVLAGASGTNFGTAKELLVQDAGAPFSAQTSKSYIQFDLSGLEGDVESASLHVYGVNVSQTGGFQVMVYGTNNTGWSEQELNWNNHYGKTFSWEGITGGTDWKEPPASDAEYGFQIPRFYFVNPLMAEYLATSDRVYSDHLVMMMMDFIYDTESYGGEQGAGSYPRTLDSAIRAYNWINAYQVLRESPSLTPSSNVAILKTLWKTAQFLENRFTDNSNWGAIESKGFYHIAAYFPEFAQSKRWEKLLGQRLEHLFSSIYLKDGAYTESSTTYAAIAIQEFLNIKRFGTLNNKRFSEDYDKQLRRAGKYVMDISFPNGRDPMLGDGAYNDHKPLVLEIGRQTNDPYLIYAGSGGEEGAVPPYTSTLYPVHNSGVLRTGWNENDLYLHINTAAGAHQHPDKLSVIVYGYGRPLIVDPGAYTYSEDDISNWLRKTTKAHNTIEINGKAQEVGCDGDVHTLIHNQGFDFLAGNTLGTPGYEHERSILFVKPGFWIVSDHITGGTGVNNYEQNWHVLPQAGVSIDPGTKAAATSFADGGPNIQIVPADPADIHAGLTNGYYSERFYTVTDAKYVSYLKQAEGDVTFDTVLYPVRNDDDTKVTVERLNLDVERSTATALKIEKASAAGLRTGYYYLSHEKQADPPRERGFSDYRFDGKSVYVEEQGRGALRSALIVSGSILCKKDRDIIKSSLPIEDLSLSWEDTTLSVNGRELIADEDYKTAIAIYAPKANRVMLNGEKVSFTRKGEYVYAARVTALCNQQTES
ncbi:heparinase II/III family protein [Paenibacillus abyssi]|nr:heparinase II/III family protein [Paenibacillus abyssi]